MARTYKQIKSDITTPFMANETLAADYGFVPGADFDAEFSIVSFENITFSVVATAIFVVEQIFDTHKKEVDDIIEAKMPHRPSWYRTKALAFQYGFNLIQDTDKYDNTGYTDEEIEASKIIKYSAVTKNGGQLLIKIASETGGVLEPLTDGQKEAFNAYVEEIADCGVKYIVVNHLPDILNLYIRIFRDPLVLNADGMSILNGNYPVQDAIHEYMNELPFNGELVLAHLTDKLQKVEGVKIPDIYAATTQAIDINNPETYLPEEYITTKTVPAAGYFTIPNFNYVIYVV